MDEWKETLDKEYLDFLRLLKSNIKEQHWTQKNLCKALSRSESWLSKIIKGKRGMDVKDFMKISKLLRISLSKLMPDYNQEKKKVPNDEDIAIKLLEFIPENILDILIEMRKK